MFGAKQRSAVRRLEAVDHEFADIRAQVRPCERERSQLDAPARRVLHRSDDLGSHEVAEPVGPYRDDYAYERQQHQPEQRARDNQSDLSSPAHWNAPGMNFTLTLLRA